MANETTKLTDNERSTLAWLQNFYAHFRDTEVPKLGEAIFGYRLAAVIIGANARDREVLVPWSRRNEPLSLPRLYSGVGALTEALNECGLCGSSPAVIRIRQSAVGGAWFVFCARCALEMMAQWQPPGGDCVDVAERVIAAWEKEAGPLKHGRAGLVSHVAARFWGTREMTTTDLKPAVSGMAVCAGCDLSLSDLFDQKQAEVLRRVREALRTPEAVDIVAHAEAVQASLGAAVEALEGFKPLVAATRKMIAASRGWSYAACDFIAARFELEPMLAALPATPDDPKWSKSAHGFTSRHAYASAMAAAIEACHETEAEVEGDSSAAINWRAGVRSVVHRLTKMRAALPEVSQ